MIMRQAVFLDRDGVINETVYRGESFFVAGKKARYTAPFTYEEFTMKPDAKTAMTILRQTDFLLILATSQPDMAYGTQKKEDYEKIMTEISALGFDDIFVCLHGRDENCVCKKPKIGLFLDAKVKWNLDFLNCYMVGDTAKDMKAGKNIGAKIILIDADYNRELECDFRVKNLLEAANLILKIEREGGR
jgi:histidinol-phosphate phosphatase family protein